VAFLIALNIGMIDKVYSVFFSIPLLAFFFWLVYRSSHGFGGVVGKLLGARSITYIGKISYGIYIYHNFVPSFIQNLVAPIRLPSPYMGILQILLCTGATVLIASLSWHILESPLNNLRRYFKYAKEPATVAQFVPN
jgi:peptidoglycan/LPS O-acetylase OafA/YrhL